MRREKTPASRKPCMTLKESVRKREVKWKRAEEVVDETGEEEERQNPIQSEDTLVQRNALQPRALQRNRHSITQEPGFGAVQSRPSRALGAVTRQLTTGGSSCLSHCHSHSIGSTGG
jgi:hypothetical protein